MFSPKRLAQVSLMKSEKGVSLIETMVALAILGIIAAVFLGALATSSSSRAIADERASAKILAESQMENIKKQEYKFSYDAIPIPDEYTSYAAEVTVDPIRNSQIQKITITIRHQNQDVTSLESYKVNR